MKCKAFTLIELLVVICVIALLTAILIPCLQRSRQQTQTVFCRSNIRQLTLGLIAYETETGNFPYSFDGTQKEPPPGGYPGYFQYDRMGWWWFNFISEDFVKTTRDTGILWCPSRKVKDSSIIDDILCGNYGVNQSICKSSHGRKAHAEFIGTPLRAADIQHQSETLLIVDAGYSMINWWHVTDKPPAALGSMPIEDTAYIPGLGINKDRALWPGLEEDAIYGRHLGNIVNIGFADGHVDQMKADNLFVEKAGDIYKNLSPLWLPK
jgi:prepilin-type N-terminal cleavage/methylation domain-containing protein/prepilin-type processing-associated H-X9-DG protein